MFPLFLVLHIEHWAFWIVDKLSATELSLQATYCFILQPLYQIAQYKLNNLVVQADTRFTILLPPFSK